jgi:hypothetical protein
MENNVNSPLFKYIGNFTWQSRQAEWTEEEMVALYYVLDVALNTSKDYENRMHIVYLMEKIFKITDTITFNEIINKKGMD